MPGKWHTYKVGGATFDTLDAALGEIRRMAEGHAFAGPRPAMRFLFTDKSGRGGSHSFDYSRGEDVYSRYSEFEEWDEGMDEDETIAQWLENAEIGDEWDYAGSFKLTRTE